MTKAQEKALAKLSDYRWHTLKEIGTNGNTMVNLIRHGLVERFYKKSKRELYVRVKLD